MNNFFNENKIIINEIIFETIKSRHCFINNKEDFARDFFILLDNIEVDYLYRPMTEIAIHNIKSNFINLFQRAGNPNNVEIIISKTDYSGKIEISFYDLVKLTYLRELDDIYNCLTANYLGFK